jgi:hypothetical protein
MVRRTHWLLASVAALVVIGSGVLPASAASPKAHHVPTAPKLTQQGHVTFWECPAKTTGVLIGVNTLTLHPGNTLTINFIVRNEAATACNFVAPYAGLAPGPTASTLHVGPCGSMGFEIEGAHHRDIWPGPQPFNCPALGFAQLQPNGTTAGSGSWAQTLPSGTTRVRAGTYTLLVAGHFSFPLQVKAH